MYHYLLPCYALLILFYRLIPRKYSTNTYFIICSLQQPTRTAQVYNSSDDILFYSISINLLLNVFFCPKLICSIGGEPTNITDLTYEQLKDFHKTHYHPSNSWLITYGIYIPNSLFPCSPSPPFKNNIHCFAYAIYIIHFSHLTSPMPLYSPVTPILTLPV